LPDEIINVFDSWARPITGGTPEEANFYSCFISYSHSDRTFARSIHDVLTEHGIHCWLDEHQILPGDDIYDMVDQGINQWDKILLCCSQNSLNSPWVDRELDKALQKEEKLWHERGRKVFAIIPLDLDGFLFEWNSGKSSMLKSRLAADFKGWQNDSAKFEGQLNKIVRSLRTDEGARVKASESKL
jgi:TIR domain-containing protein